MRPLIGFYTNPSGQTWFGTRSWFANKPINAHEPFTNVGHIIIGRAYNQPPSAESATEDG